MAQVGKMRIEHTDDGFVGTGKISTRSLRETFYIEPVKPDPKRKKPPTHVLFCVLDDERVNVGEAWEYCHKEGEFAGAAMFNLNFYDPDFPQWCENIPAYASSADNSAPLRIMFDRSWS